MSFFMSSRGRHHAPSRFVTGLSRSVRATVAVAAAGGIAATAAGNAEASAPAGVATLAASPNPASQAAPASAALSPVSVSLPAVAAAAPSLRLVKAEPLVVRTQRPVQRPAEPSSERATERAAQPAERTTSGSTSRSASGSTSRSTERPVVSPRPAAQQARRQTATTQRTSTTRPRTQSPAPAPAPTKPTTTTPEAPASNSSIVAIAKRYLGVPYVHGGSTPAGFDCSGFTQYVYRQAGISIPRTVGGQIGAMRHVSNPQPGDVVALTYGHVGIYLGNGMMIAAPRPGKNVQIQSVYTTPVAYLRA